SSLPAASAILPNVTVRPEGLWVITLFAALHSPAGTFHDVAAAWISMVRAAAPPLRTISLDSRMPREPAVHIRPPGLPRFRLSPGVGNSIETFDQSHSSSSASSWARPVAVP